RCKTCGAMVEVPTLPVFTSANAATAPSVEQTTPRFPKQKTNVPLYVGLGAGAVIMVIIMVAITAGSSAKQKRLSELKVEAEKYLYEIELKQRQYAGRQASDRYGFAANAPDAPVQVELETKLRGIEEEIREIEPRSKILDRLVERRTLAELQQIGAEIQRDESNNLVAVKLAFQSGGSTRPSWRDLTPNFRNPSDEDMKLLARFPALKTVDLSGTSITDAGLFHLKGLTSLQSLTLHNTNVTDAGLGNLKGMVNLETLDVRDTKVTPAAVEEFRRAVPSCMVKLSEASR
ncbi:MAG: hypothetical protein WEB58_14130, partial [Planctomycetaceae bacterium]